jgi:hypothetical protein
MLGLLNLALQLPKRTLVARNIGTCLLFVKLDEVVDDGIVQVFTTPVSVTSGGRHLKDAIVDAEEGDIKGAFTLIVDNLRLSTFKS